MEQNLEVDPVEMINFSLISMQAKLAQDLEEKFKTLLPQIRSRKQLKKFDFFKKAIEKVKIR